jgi:hypothetical protein
MSDYYKVGLSHTAWEVNSSFNFRKVTAFWGLAPKHTTTMKGKRLQLVVAGHLRGSHIRFKEKCMQYAKKTLSRGGRTLALTAVALVALTGSVYAASGAVFGVHTLASGTVVPPTNLAVSSSISRSTIFRKHTPRCAIFEYRTNMRSLNNVTVGGRETATHGWQDAGSHTFTWCGTGANGKMRSGFYGIKVAARTATQTQATSRVVHLKKK